MKTFVAGGTGVLGRRVARLLAEAGHEVRATARGEERAAALRAVGVQPVDVDLYDATAVRRAVAGCDAVLRLTTKIPRVARMRSRRAWVETGRLRNESATLLVDACVAEGVGTYVHESIGFIYAPRGDGWIDEESPLDLPAEGPLADAARGEHHAHRFTAAGGRGVVLRFAGFYSPDSSVTRDMATMARRGMMALVGPMDSWFSSIWLDDAAAATVAALSAPAGVYNVADDRPVRLREFLEEVNRAAGRQRTRRMPEFLGPLLFGITWSYLTRSQRLGAGRLRDATGWRPAVPDAHEGWRRIAEDWAAERRVPAAG